MKNKTTKILHLFLLVSILWFSGCTLLKSNNLKTNMYNTFKTLEVVYIQGMELSAELYRQGLLSTEQKEKIIQTGDAFRLSYEAAAEAFRAYVMAPTPDNENRMFRVIAVMLESESAFRRLIHEYE